jgi:hypothetical protein
MTPAITFNLKSRIKVQSEWKFTVYHFEQTNFFDLLFFDMVMLINLYSSNIISNEKEIKL